MGFRLQAPGFRIPLAILLALAERFCGRRTAAAQRHVDNGFEASAGYFVVPQTLEIYGRTSAVFGEFRESSEYALGTNWHSWSNRGFRLITELNKMEASPTSSIQTIYNAGMTGWNFALQTQLYF